AAVGIVRPLHLTEEQARRWGEVFGDYEIIAPFPQLGRPVYQLEAGEFKEKEVKRAVGFKLPSLSLAGTLEKLGWQRGYLHDHGDYHESYKGLESAGIRAVAEHEPGMFAEKADLIDPEQKVTRCIFLRGNEAPGWRTNEWQPVSLGQVDAVVLSEVMADLAALAAKGV